jgi:hypothetical protein
LERFEFNRLVGGDMGSVRLRTRLSVRTEGHEHVTHEGVGVQSLRHCNPGLVDKPPLIVE